MTIHSQHAPRGLSAVVAAKPARLRTAANAAVAAFAALAMAAGALLAGAAPALAAPALAAPGDAGESYAIEIHKLEQPDELGQPANGLPQDTTGLTPVAGATFTATRVPGIDLTTNAGQQAAGSLSAAEAAALVAGEPVAASGVTDGLGNATLAPLATGLYFVRETVVPAGYVGSTPFLVALPLTDPETRDAWLSTVHVYPKNAAAAITLTVDDADAVALGDTVHWQSRSDIPNQPELDGYRVVQRIDPKLELAGAGGSGGAGGSAADRVTVALSCAPACPALTPGVHYTASFDADTNSVTIDFLPAGLDALEQAAAQDPSAQVTVDYDTTVLAEGELANEAVLYPGGYAIDHDLGVSDTAVTKWGPLSVLVHEQGNPSAVIAGACFMLYRSEADALARHNPIVVGAAAGGGGGATGAGAGAGAAAGVSEWKTDSAGRFVVEGLRFSDFANGLDREVGDPLYRLYWAVPTCLPDGWSWVDPRPVAGAVNSAVEFQTLLFNVVKAKDLAVTGGQIAGIGLLAALLIGGGLLVAVRRRRDRAEPETVEP